MSQKSAAEKHKNVPADWYYRSIKENIIQKYVHTRRFKEVAKLIEPTGGKILDIGSADGMFTSVIKYWILVVLMECLRVLLQKNQKQIK